MCDQEVRSHTFVAETSRPNVCCAVQWMGVDVEVACVVHSEPLKT